MSFRTHTRSYINRILRHANARVESLTAERQEDERLRGFQQNGHFERPVFPLPPSFQGMAKSQILNEVIRNKGRIAEFGDRGSAPTEFGFENDYFFSPDAEVLYAVITLFRPQTILEVGSGNSTKLARTAIRDHHLTTKIVSIDPDPRTDIAAVTDSVFRQRVESLDPEEIAGRLHVNDVLFIDSSHILKSCNDVVFLYLQVLPLLEQGVLIHIHDVFMPYDYPPKWVIDYRWPWNEQYLVQAILAFSDQFEVLWAAHYLQRTMRDFEEYFPRTTGRLGSSLWLRKKVGRSAP